MDSVVYCFDMFKTVLAIMDSGIPNHRSGSSHSKTNGRFDRAKGLLYHAGRFFLSASDHIDYRNVLPSTETAEIRDRSVLAALIAPVDPQQAQRLADLLIAEFGTIGRILAESPHALRRVVGKQSKVIDLLTATDRLIDAKLQDQLPKKVISATDENLVYFLRASLGSQPVEKLMVIFLDNLNALLALEEFGSGTPNKLYIHPRNILKRALELNASGIIMVHNHPAGNPMPSGSDIKQTNAILDLCRKLEIKLLDHIVITNSQWTSFRQLSLL